MFALTKLPEGISHNTPHEAIIDAAAVLGIKVEKEKTSNVYISQVISAISASKIKQTSRNVTRDNIKLVAQFVNPFTQKWNMKKLSIAYSTTICYLENGITEKPSVGYPTMDNPYLVSPAVAVSILTKNGFRTHFSMSVTELEKLLNFSLLDRERQMQILVSRLLRSDINFTASNLLFAKRKKSLDYDVIEIQRLIMTKQAENTCVPTSDEMAIAIAAVKYKTNIFTAKRPCDELIALSDGTFPRSSTMRKIYNINPRAFNILCYFSEIFPHEMYKEHDLINLCKRNGIKHTSGDGNLKTEDLYSLLVTKSRSNGFYRSVVMHVKSLTSVINMTDLTTKYVPVVSYGKDSDYKLLTVKELIITFEAYMSFQLGVTEPLSIVAIDDLARIAKDYITVKSISSKDKERWKKLLAVINLIYTEYTKTEVHKIRFLELSKGREDKITKILLSLFHLSLYMRGWDGESKWPIRDEDIPRFTDAEYEIKKRKSVKRTFRQVEYLNKIITDEIATLPLVRYYNDRYELSKDFQQGATIGERLKIVQDDLIINACIGMSSNWFLHTSYFYLETIDMEPNINIADVCNTTETVRRISNSINGS